VPNELQHADVLLLPAHHEPFGMVVVEAMLSGVVPIVSVVTGAAEVIHDSVNGRILLSSDPKAWAGAMRDVLNRLPAYRQACIDSRTTLSYQRHIDAVTWIYEQIIHQRNVIAE
jgi:glycosyltransferase involved in cell wall biosynthesis